MRSLSITDLPEKLTGSQLGRKFVKITLSTPILNQKETEISNDYWKEANSFGLIDLSYQTTTQSVIVASVKDEAEAKALAENDPMVKSGTVKVEKIESL